MSKEELIKELMRVSHDNVMCIELNHLSTIADFILERDKKIVGPLFNLNKKCVDMGMAYYHAIKQTLKNAGVE